MQKVRAIIFIPLLIILESFLVIMKTEHNKEIATFGSGCFWCTEAVFERLEGVDKVVSGYSGGEVKNPSYREVTTGRTGHAEVCQIFYDPEVISYEELLDVFWHTHDPCWRGSGNDRYYSP